MYRRVGEYACSWQVMCRGMWLTRVAVFDFVRKCCRLTADLQAELFST